LLIGLSRLFVNAQAESSTYPFTVTVAVSAAIAPAQIATPSTSAAAKWNTRHIVFISTSVAHTSSYD
jgi:hypothetical protein